MLEIIAYRLRKKNVVEGYIGKEPQQTAQPKCQSWKGKSQNAVVLQNKLLHWDLKSAIVAQQRPLPAESWQVCA